MTVVQGILGRFSLF
ncbi:hypothetical protein E9160_05795 [Klebsiella pneumoniae]|nr:hypothetical protein AM382_14050 [Klebsiella pneumoniae]RUL22225.1 hypothetical protein ELP98_06435 [Klebsiella pneumoniae subsp. pneumoniae]AYW27563.1 hypothetical protein DPQ49_23105 [Klebsiella pneumoniae]EIW9128082.1 hypothetical protein [Klebsiella pneumoniae]EIW9133288.1 hypothetical protein [Klebsiella pneumoniae]